MNNKVWSSSSLSAPWIVPSDVASANVTCLMRDVNVDQIYLNPTTNSF